MTDLAGLIERLNAATGPSRELDLAIQDYLGVMLFPTKISPHDWVVKIGDKLIEVVRYPGGAMTTDERFVPRYTVSLDAALTLVPAHCAFELRKTIDFSYGATVYGQDTHGDANAATLAISMCLAALRARSLP
jgi:hypothetical protein